MNDMINNKQIFNKIASLIYRDKKRIIIALIVSIASYYFSLYPTDRLSYIVDGIAGGNIDFDGVVNEILRIVFGWNSTVYLSISLKKYYTFIGYDKVIKDMTYDIQYDIYRHTPVIF